jgi:hypothetical protein
MAVTIQIRGDTAAAWTAANPVLADRELALERDTGLLKLGNGITAWNALPYFSGGDVDPAAFTALQGEVATARGSRSALDNRIEAISRYSSPCAADLPTGEVLDNSRVSTAPTTIAGTANAIRLAPFITSRPFTATAIGGRVTTAAAAGQTRFLVYGSDAGGWPGPKLFEGDEDLSSAAVGAVFHSGVELPFEADRVYWLGIRYNATVTTMAAIQNYGVPNLGLIGGMNGTTYASMVQRVVTFATPAPENWAFVASERLTGSPPAIRLQVA